MPLAALGVIRPVGELRISRDPVESETGVGETNVMAACVCRSLQDVSTDFGDSAECSSGWINPL